MTYDKSPDHLVKETAEQRFSDDGTLFRRIATGDERAFDGLFQQFRPRLFSYLLRITKSPEDAEELTQEVFIKLWINRMRFAEVDSPPHYIFVVARNAAIDYLRKAALDSRMRQTLWESVSAHQGSTEEKINASDTARRINEAMVRLSVQKQTVFKLSRMEGLTHDQIAARLNISRNTVKNHIIASLKFIKNYLLQS